MYVEAKYNNRVDQTRCLVLFNSFYCTCTLSTRHPVSGEEFMTRNPHWRQDWISALASAAADLTRQVGVPPLFSSGSEGLVT